MDYPGPPWLCTTELVLLLGLGGFGNGQCYKAMATTIAPQNKEFKCVMLTRGAGYNSAFSGLDICMRCFPSVCLEAPGNNQKAQKD